MNALSTEEINRIRSSVNIVDVISSYLPLTQRGKNYFGVCPFHDDHSPSMSVSKEKQIYKCFSCGATGNVYHFLMEYEHISFPEAVGKVAQLAGIPIEITDYKKEKNKKYTSLYEIYDLSLKFYQNHLNTASGASAKEYLKKREIGEDIIKEFSIGLAPVSGDILAKLLMEKKYSKEELLKSGLLFKNEYGYHDMYRNRIMFPLWDLDGKVVGFSGRVFHGEKESKYINTMETEIFHKGELVYNYHRAKESARMENKIIVMEGFMDVIRANTIGIQNVVAMMGTAVTKTQANLIKRMARDVILCFDGDEAGSKATYSCANEFMELGVTPKIVHLEEDLDPDDYIKKYGKERFLSKLEHPMNVMDFKLSYLKKNKDFNNSVDMASYVNTVITELAKIKDPVLQEISLKKISLESNLEIDFLKERLKSVQAPQKKQEVKKEVIEKKQKTKYEIAEGYFLYYMLRSEEVIELYLEKSPYLPTSKYRMLARLISKYYEENNSINLADFMSFLEDDTDSFQALREINALNYKETYKEEELLDNFHALEEYGIHSEMKRLQNAMKNKEDPMEKAKLAQQLLELRKRRDSDD